MGGEILKDEEGKEHYIFDQSELYEDEKMGDKLEDFEILRIHTDSSVKSVHSLINQKIYLMKSIDFKKNNYGPKYKDSLINKINDYLKLNYFYLLKIYKYFVTDNEIHIIMEHTNNGSIKDYIKLHSSLKIFISEEYLWNLFIQCAKALRFLHSNGIVHQSISPRHLLMTNEKLIKLELCPQKEELINYQPPEKELSFKGDVYSLGCVFYQLVFVVQLLENNQFNKFKEECYYSDELINIVKLMLEKDPEKRPTSEELCDIIIKEYDNKITKNSSIFSLISCLFSINSIEKEFLQNNNTDKFNNKNITPISCSFYDCLNGIKDKQKWNSAIKHFRRYFGTKNPKLDGNKEINPFYILIFLVESMHKELNVRQNQNLNENQGYLIKRKEDKTNKEDMARYFLRYYKENFNSIISKTFFGIMRNRFNCEQCGLITYSFNFFCLLYFDLNKISQNIKENKIPLIDFFSELQQGKFSSNLNSQYFCKGCSKQTHHGIQKDIFYTPHSLIICFQNNNDNCDIAIDYPDFLDLKNEREYPFSPECFNLKGFINKINENGEEKYISYFKSPINNKIYLCENDYMKEENDWDKNKGKTIMLFYEAAV